MYPSSNVMHVDLRLRTVHLYTYTSPHRGEGNGGRCCCEGDEEGNREAREMKKEREGRGNRGSLYVMSHINDTRSKATSGTQVPL